MDTKALRQKILDLAIRGKLVLQDSNDEPAAVLLERIREQKKQMVKEGKLKAKDIKNDTVIFVGEDKLHYEKFQDGTVKCIEDEIPFDVPEGWEWCRLSDVYNFIDYRGATPTKIFKGIPLITAKNVKSGYIDYTVDDYISEEEFKERQQRGISRKGDILFTTEAPLGNAALADIDKFSAGQRLITFQHYGIQNELINYVMLMFILSDFFQQQLYINKTGSTVAGIKAAILKTLWIPIPPYKEQVRLSNTLKTAIDLIESISKNQKTLSVIVNNAKSKILDLAIRGKLVPQDPNDEPAYVLLERIRSEKEELIKQGKIKRDKKVSIIFRGDDNSYYEKIGKEIHCINDEIPFELPESWCWVRWGSIAKSIQYGYNAPAKNSGRIKMLRISDIQGNAVCWDTVPFCDIAETDIPTYLLKENDILFARTGGTVGKSYLVGTVPDEAIYAGYLIRTRYSDELCPRYLKYFMESSLYWKQLKNGTTATAQPNCNGQTLSKMLFPLPPVKEQFRIVNMMDLLVTKMEELAV